MIIPIAAIALLVSGMVQAEAKAPPIETIIESNTTSQYTSFSPDGQRIVSSKNNNVVIWDVATGRELHTLRGHGDRVTDVLFSADGERLYSTGMDGVLIAWDARAGRELLRSKLHKTTPGRDLQIDPSFYALALTPDQKTIAVSLGIGNIRLFDADRLEMQRDLGIPLSMGSDRLRITPDGKRVIGYGKYGRKQAYDLATGKDASAGECVESKADGGVITLCSAEGKTLRTMPLPGHENEGLSGKFGAVAISADGKLAVVEHQVWLTEKQSSRRLDIFDAASGALLRTFFNGGGNPVFAPDARLVLCGTHLIDVNTGATVRDLGSRLFTPNHVHFSLDGKQLITTWDAPVPAHRSIIQTWDLVNLRPIRTWTEPSGFAGDVNQLPSPDRRMLLVGTDDAGRNGHLWDLERGAVVAKFPGFTDDWSGGAILTPAKGSKGTRLVSGKDARKGLWVGVTEEPGGKVTTKASASFYGQRGRAMAVSADEKWLAYAGENFGLNLVELATGKGELLDLPDEAHHSETIAMAFSPDGRMLAITEGTLLDLWDLAARKRVLSEPASGSFSAPSLAFTPDSQRLYVGTRTGEITIWDCKTLARTGQLLGHSSTIWSLSVSPDGTLLASVGDATLRLWSTATNTELVALVVRDDHEYAAVTPDGHYTATKGALDSVHFSQGFDVLPLESFDVLYNRPDIVLARLGLVSRPHIELLKRAYDKRLAMLGIDPAQLSGELHLPELRITSSPPLETADDKIKLSIQASDTKFALDRLNIYVNDIPIHGALGVPLDKPHVRAVERELEIELGEGRNKIEVSVVNDKGVEGIHRSLEVLYTGAKRQHTLFVAAIGVSLYDNHAFDLTYAAKDASDLASQLQKSKRFDQVQPMLLLDKAAKREAIVQLRESLLKTHVDDTVVVFVAGHGWRDDKLDYYFGTPDINFAAPAERGLPYEALESLLDGIPARQKVLLMDTCFAGDVDKSLAASIPANSAGVVKERVVASAATRGLKRIELPISDSFELQRELFADLRRGSGAVVIASAGGGESALESAAWKNGVFTYVLLSTLRTLHGDTNQDGALSVSELRDVVSQQVEQLTGGRQKPNFSRERLGFDFILY